MTESIDVEPKEPVKAAPARVQHRRIRITRSGDESTARCTCGWSTTTTPDKVGSAAAAHARA